jgi:hypothetical protein
MRRLVGFAFSKLHSVFAEGLSFISCWFRARNTRLRQSGRQMYIFFFQLVIIFLPGLIWERIVTRYALKREPTQFEIALRTRACHRVALRADPLACNDGGAQQTNHFMSLP